MSTQSGLAVIESPAVARPDASAAYSALELAKTWVATYRFSQGLPSLQKEIITYACERIIPEAVLADLPVLEESFELGESRVREIVTSDGHVDDFSDGVGLGQLFKEDVIDVVTAQADAPPSASATKIGKSMLRRDASYLLGGGSEFERTFGVTDHRYFSYAIRYILLGKQTGRPIIDEVFAAVREIFPTISSEAISTYRESIAGTVMVLHNTYPLQAIVDAHVQANPQDSQPMARAAAELGVGISV